jgi:hypothetical protein
LPLLTPTDQATIISGVPKPNLYQTPITRDQVLSNQRELRDYEHRKATALREAQTGKRIAAQHAQDTQDRQAAAERRANLASSEKQRHEQAMASEAQRKEEAKANTEHYKEAYKQAVSILEKQGGKLDLDKAKEMADQIHGHWMEHTPSGKAAKAQQEKVQGQTDALNKLHSTLMQAPARAPGEVPPGAIPAGNLGAAGESTTLKGLANTFTGERLRTGLRAMPERAASIPEDVIERINGMPENTRRKVVNMLKNLGITD